MGNRQMVDILTAVLADGLPAAEAACAEAIAQGVHSADVVLNVLARQRNPGPPATIIAPAVLTLHHAPIADCARYDITVGARRTRPETRESSWRLTWSSALGCVHGPARNICATTQHFLGFVVRAWVQRPCRIYSHHG